MQTPLFPRLVVATHNRGKAQEFATMLNDIAGEIVTAADLNLAEPDETGDSFTANARLKAQAAAQASGCVALADDSGLCVTALNNAPGIYSARWAGESRDFSFAMARIHQELGDTPDRAAHFIAALVLCWPDGKTLEVEGRIDGTLVWPPRGTQGHGYDPIFQPLNETRTFAEMTDAEKNARSHRHHALTALRHALKTL